MSPTPQARPAPETIDPRWLLKALGLAVGGAVVLAYLAIALLVGFGAWQRILHPTPLGAARPGVPFQQLRFDAAQTGLPRLAGWWLPAEAPGTHPTLLVLHDGSGSLADTAEKLDTLHRADANVFAFDYRGFGQSTGPHPTEARMLEDSAAALDYLVDTRHLAPGSIAVYGHGLGAALAASLAASHPELGALILDQPDPEAGARLLSDQRTALIPVSLLIAERFDVRSSLAQTHQPKLLLGQEPASPAIADLYRQAPDPRLTVWLGQGAEGERERHAALTRFLDQYLPAAR